ncbi:type 2 lanthipeptide synthetase LanM [Paenibacillus sp. PCH8]|uniref:type 2 lanthipeptide synthetase LanM n=1 Tax=Paenibacillus sp. PCH8 TaxID=2066524 RepID=UPI0015E2F8A0|nr:type 2 lanthipeptide synthetase LanM [Paenibacillus sp. PCH8]
MKNNQELLSLLTEYFIIGEKTSSETAEYFYTFYNPFCYSIKRLIESNFMSFMNSTIFHSIYFNNIQDEILNKIREICSNTLLTELNINRVSGSLLGETKEERYSYFVEQILGSQEGFFEIIEVYSELLSLIVLSINQILEEQIYILTKVREDYNDIRSIFFHSDFILIGYKFGMGDSHNNGKSVKLIESSLGKFVYKPKSLSLEKHFNATLDWINSKGSSHNRFLRYPKVIDKQEYGWQEYINNRDLKSSDSARDFYYRQGINIALMYILNASDFHYENLIADESHPVLIDIETFFSSIESYDGDELTESYQSSVLSTMMLPMDYGKILDFEISGLSGKDGQVSSLYSNLKLTNINSDDMQFIKKPFVVSGKRNIPSFEGEKREASQYIDEICEGFTYGYNLIRSFKDEFSKIIDIFKTDTIRVVLRPTQTYAEFIAMSKYPKYLISNEKRKELFNLLLESESEKFPLVAIKEEMKSLENEDVPYFSTTIGSKSLKINTVQMDNYFKASPMSYAKEKINLLNNDDLKLQVKIIKLSLQFELSKTDVDSKYIDSEEALRIHIDDKAAIIEQIDYWVENILNKSTKLPSGRIQWFSHINDHNHKAKLGYMMYGLYDGITGMSILFSLLSKYINSEKYEPYYSLLLEDIVTNEEKVLEHENNICGFGNTASIIYTYLYLGKLRNEEMLISKAVELAGKFSIKVISMIEQEQIEIDFVSGISSLLAILCRVNNASETKELSINIGVITKYIIDEIEVQMSAQDYRTGFAHGFSGIAFALDLASAYTSIPHNIMVALLKMENEKYDPSMHKWCDTRKNDNEHSEDYWCQGSVGVYYSRNIMKYNMPQDILMLDQLKDNSEKSLQRFTNYSLCHGYLGNFLILKYNNALHEKYFYVPKNGNDYIGGLGANAESIGLFLGEAGLVYFLISILIQDIPKVLYLEV